MNVTCLDERGLRRPYGTPAIVVGSATPPLKRWANNRCAYGAVASAIYKIVWKMKGMVMNMRSIMALLMICMLFTAGITSAQAKAKKTAVEPTAFYEDCIDGDKGRPCLFDHPVPIPDNVLDALRATKEAKESHDRLKDYDRDDFAQLFKAVVIHLGDPKEIDYVLLSEFPMGGADAPWFWIVRYDQTHPKVIFFTFAGGFRLLKTKNNGYPDIRSSAWTASDSYTNVYHYSGQRYILVHKYHKENKPEP
jgi:hypothetical protein